MLGAKVAELAYPLLQPTVAAALRLNDTGVQSMRPDERELGSGDLARFVQERGLVLGAACGTSAYGGGHMAGVELAALATLSLRRQPWEIAGDGLVTEDECTAGDTRFQADPQSAWALLPANHQELAGLIPDPQLLPHVLDWYLHIISSHQQQ
jgi:hypothetical protein